MRKSGWVQWSIKLVRSGVKSQVVHMFVPDLDMRDEYEESIDGGSNSGKWQWSWGKCESRAWTLNSIRPDPEERNTFLGLKSILSFQKPSQVKQVKFPVKVFSLSSEPTFSPPSSQRKCGHNIETWERERKGWGNENTCNKYTGVGL